LEGKLRKTIAKDFSAIYEFAADHAIDMPTAVYSHALCRIDAAIASQGTHCYFSNGIL